MGDGSTPRRAVRPPPPVLDGAQVLAYASTAGPVRWTGRLYLMVGGERLGQVPRLAIVRNLFDGAPGFLVLHCDARWQSLGAVGGASLRECRQKAERWYEGITPLWQRTWVTKRAAERWLRDACADSVCSTCGRLPMAVDGMFSRRGTRVCFHCVREMNGQLPQQDVVASAA